MGETTGADLLRDWLRRRGEPVEQVIDTHISVIALTATRAYKLRKAVLFSFVDLREPAARAADCHDEVRLNSRLSPDVYLGVAPVTDAAGIVVDHVVVMRRLPDDRSLRHLATSGSTPLPCLDELAERLARFHAEVPVVAAPDLRRLWHDEISQARGLPALDPTTVAHAGVLAQRYLAGREPLLAARERAGRIRDGHGDLRADAVYCLPDGVRVIDCLEFSARLRAGDAIGDVAFLAMDLRWLGRADLAAAFAAAYRAAAGEDWPVSLLELWVGYRALIRAKVAVLSGDPGAGAGHLRLARDALRAAQPRLVLIGGLPGTGKSTLAAALPDVTVVRSDIVRDELSARTAADRYTPAAVDAVYRRLLARAETLLAAGRHVVLDASWADARHRQQARDVAEGAGAVLVAVRCVAPAAVAEARIAARLTAGTDVSQADVAVARAMAGRFDPWPEALALDTTVAVPDAVTAVAAAWDGDQPGLSRPGRAAPGDPRASRGG